MVEKSGLLMAKAKVSLACLLANADVRILSTCIESVSVMFRNNGRNITGKGHF